MQGLHVTPTTVTTMTGEREVDLVVDAHLNGPPDVVQGGIAAGMLLSAARAVDRFGAPVTAVDARLMAPTPTATTVRAFVARATAATYDVETRSGDTVLVEGTVELAGHDPVPRIADLTHLATVPLPEPRPQYAAPDCWVCGPDNPHGLHLHPAWTGDGAIVQGFIPPDELAGDDGALDPVVVAALLDCPTVWCAQAHLDTLGMRGAVLAGFHVRYFADVPVGGPVRIIAEMDDADGRKIRARSAIVDEDGTVYAMASAFQYAVPDMPGVPPAA
jgi:acyl-coenzyme A thioesterase PaaI-like protein